MLSYRQVSIFLWCLFCITSMLAYGLQTVAQTSAYAHPDEVGAHQTHQYLPLLTKKRVGLVVNQTSMIGKTHLVDSLLYLKVAIKIIFAPEHGFRGNADAGEKIADSIDFKTHIPVVSLYGKHYKPTKEELENIDVVVFDIQDVGARFYTYLSTLHYVMEACATEHKKLIVLDRPNPNIFYVDGPVLDTTLRSFVGLHPVPIVYGMSIGEYAQMINGEHWLKDGIRCDLSVIKINNYHHQKRYQVPVKPSPNLPNELAILLYPSLCLFEGTSISVGRGTPTPFQIFGHPDFNNHSFAFTPVSIVGMSRKPPFENQICYGEDLRNFPLEKCYQEPHLELKWLLYAYENLPHTSLFFNPFFEKLAGNRQFRQQIAQKISPDSIRKTWQKEIDAFLHIRAKYLLYPAK